MVRRPPEAHAQRSRCCLDLTEEIAERRRAVVAARDFRQAP
jgi:hypothetical protein